MSKPLTAKEMTEFFRDGARSLQPSADARGYLTVGSFAEPTLRSRRKAFGMVPR
jgi:hypothetical protein